MITDVTKEMEINNERNYGIDLLRIVAMIMIPALHIIGILRYTFVCFSLCRF